jgi:4-aminobutyrate aminotransferase
LKELLLEATSQNTIRKVDDMENIRLPRLSGELPGPKAKKVIEKDSNFTSPSYTRGYPLVAEEAKGAIVKDPDDNYFLDFAAGIAVCSTGHCHPEVVKAIKNQAEKLLHISGTDFYYPIQADVAEKVAKMVGKTKKKRVFFGNSGAEAIECAIKLAKYYTGKKRFIAFFGSFHGRTTGALSLTASKTIQKERFFPLMEGVTHVPYANCYRCPFGQKYGSCKMECLSFIENVIFKTVVPPSEVAAIFFEPIQGEGGYVVPPKEFVEGLREICNKHHILLVADEVQAGCGRTGKFLATEHFGLEADIVCLAKGIASGLPLSAVVADESIMSWPPGSHASTFGGNPVALKACEATLNLLEKELMKNAKEQGEFLLSGLKEMMNRQQTIGDVRGIGLMIGVEMVKDKTSKERFAELRDRIEVECFERGLLVLGCGANTIRLCPPLVIDRDQSDFAMKTIEESIVAALDFIRGEKRTSIIA